MMKLFDITEKYGKATYAYPFEPYIVQVVQLVVSLALVTQQSLR